MTTIYKITRCVTVLMCCAVISFFVQGQQTAFNVQRQAQQTTFMYEWLDQQQQTQSLSFAIDKQNMQQMPVSASAYNPQLAQNFIRIKLLKYAQSVDPREATVRIKKQGAGINIKVSGSSHSKVNEVNEALSAMRDQAEQEYYEQKYLVPFSSTLGQSVIKQDHKRYVAESVAGLRPIVQAIKDKLNNENDLREFIEYSLSWVQTIPYNTLQDRISSNGSGYASPKQVILNNQGDCDSKSALFAALLKAYNSNIDVKMFYLPQHALLGVSMRTKAGDLSVKDDGKQYVLFEPTGPALLPLGRIDNSSRMAIRNRQYSTEGL